VRKGRIQVAATPLSLSRFTRYGMEHVVDVTYGNLRRLWDGKK